jgi:hypothetical protein
MDAIATAERFILRHQGRLIDTAQAVHSCEAVADKQAKALQRVMRCYSAKCGKARCGEREECWG